MRTANKIQPKICVPDKPSEKDFIAEARKQWRGKHPELGNQKGRPSQQSQVFRALDELKGNGFDFSQTSLAAILRRVQEILNRTPNNKLSGPTLRKHVRKWMSQNLEIDSIPNTFLPTLLQFTEGGESLRNLLLWVHFIGKFESVKTWVSREKELRGALPPITSPPHKILPEKIKKDISATYGPFNLSRYNKLIRKELFPSG